MPKRQNSSYANTTTKPGGEWSEHPERVPCGLVVEENIRNDQNALSNFRKELAKTTSRSPCPSPKIDIFCILVVAVGVCTLAPATPKASLFVWIRTSPIGIPATKHCCWRGRYQYLSNVNVRQKGEQTNKKHEESQQNKIDNHRRVRGCACMRACVSSRYARTSRVDFPQRPFAQLARDVNGARTSGSVASPKRQYNRLLCSRPT